LFVLQQAAAGDMIDRMSSRTATFLRSLLRFRLRTLLLAVLVISVAMGIYVNRVRRQQASIAAIKRLGGATYYDYARKLGDDAGQCWAPAWLRRTLGDDYFHSVVEVNIDFSVRGPANRRLTDEALAHLKGLPRLERLLLGPSQASDDGLADVGKLRHLRSIIVIDGRHVTDAGVAHLAGCKNLERLCLSDSQVGDEGLRVLSQLPRLKELWLQDARCTDRGLAHVGRMRQIEVLRIGNRDGRNFRITDAGLAHLANLPQLPDLELRNTGITDRGLVHLEGMKNLIVLQLEGTAITDTSRLQAALPNCTIFLTP
jgi:hypothetical protein